MQDPVYREVVDGLRLQAAEFAVQCRVLPEFVDVPFEVRYPFYIDYFPQLIAERLIPQSAIPVVRNYEAFFETFKASGDYIEEMSRLQSGEWYEQLRHQARALLAAFGEECSEPTLDGVAFVRAGRDSDQ